MNTPGVGAGPLRERVLYSFPNGVSRPDSNITTTTRHDDKTPGVGAGPLREQEDRIGRGECIFLCFRGSV